MAKLIFVLALLAQPIQISLSIKLHDIKTPRHSKINVSIYYESLSVETRTFFREQFKPVYDQLWDIIDIDLVPYGRTTVRNGSYTCPYGHKQCLANRIQSCAIGLLWHKNEIKKTIANFVYCMFESKHSGYKVEKVAHNCAKHFEKQWSEIESCAKISDTNQFTRNMAEKTKEVSNLFVNSRPVVKINDAYSKKAVNNLAQVVCDAYRKLNTNGSSICETDNTYEKIRVSFYYETQNQKSRNLAINQLRKLSSDNYPSLAESIEIEFVPWGFTKYTAHIDNPFECARGHQFECYGNRIHACFVDKYANILFDSKQVAKFIVCSLERSQWGGDALTAHFYCAKKYGFSELWPQINECAVNNTRNNIEVFLKMRDKTEKFDQNLTYVPWININGIHNIEAEHNLVEAVCKQYKGVIPDECELYITEIPPENTEPPGVTEISTVTTTITPAMPTTPTTPSTTEATVTTIPLFCNQNGEYNGSKGYDIFWPAVESGIISCGDCPLNIDDETAKATWLCGDDGLFEGFPEFWMCEQWITELNDQLNDTEIEAENVSQALKTLNSNTRNNLAVFTPDMLLFIVKDIYYTLQTLFNGMDTGNVPIWVDDSTHIMSQLLDQTYPWSINTSFDIASIAYKILDRVRQNSFVLGCREEDDDEGEPPLNYYYPFEAENLFVSVSEIDLNRELILFDGSQGNRTNYVSISRHVSINPAGLCENTSVGVFVENRDFVERYLVNLSINYDEPYLNSRIIGFFISNETDIIAISGDKAKVTLQNFHKLKFGDKSGCVILDLTANNWIHDKCSLDKELSDRDVTVCDCDHLGYFAAVNDPTNRENRDLKYLFTYIFAVISILILLFAIAITVIPSTIRRKSKSIYAYNMSACLLILDVILIYGTDREKSNFEYKDLCKAISIISTYLIYSCFCWILVEGYEIFRDAVFLFYGKLRISLILAYVIGYFVPLLIIGIDLIVVDFIDGLSMDSFIGHYFCFFTIYNSFWLVSVPVIIIVLLILLLLIIGLMREPTKKDVYRIVFSSTFTIWFVITWSLYTLYIVEYGVYLYYIFIIFKTILSLMILAEKVLLDKRVRLILRDYLKGNFNNNSDDLLENEYSDNEKNVDTDQNMK